MRLTLLTSLCAFATLTACASAPPPAPTMAPQPTQEQLSAFQAPPVEGDVQMTQTAEQPRKAKAADTDLATSMKVDKSSGAAAKTSHVHAAQ